MFEPAQLEALAAVQRRGSFEVAASTLHVTLCATSQPIKALLMIRAQALLATAQEMLPR